MLGANDFQIYHHPFDNSQILQWLQRACRHNLCGLEYLCGEGREYKEDVICETERRTKDHSDHHGHEPQSPQGR